MPINIRDKNIKVISTQVIMKDVITERFLDNLAKAASRTRARAKAASASTAEKLGTWPETAGHLRIKVEESPEANSVPKVLEKVKDLQERASPTSEDTEKDSAKASRVKARECTRWTDGRRRSKAEIGEAGAAIHGVEEDR